MYTNSDDGLAATGTEMVELDAAAVRTSVELVARVTAADLVRPTPCAAWTLRDLLAHMTTQHHGFAAASNGQDGPEPWQQRPLGADPVQAHRAAARQVLAAFAADGVLDRPFSLPEISTERRFPAALAISFHLVDYVVHSWDVARTLNVPVSLEPCILEAALAVARSVPGGEARLAPGAAFAPAVPCPAGSALDTIVALLGRSPTWPG